MLMRFLVVLIVFFQFFFNGFSQRFVEPDKIKSFNITVNYPEYTVKTQMLKDLKKITPNPDLSYHWYTSQKIIETKGGFDGKLLHGYYKSFYLSDQLFESGVFKYGIKHGEWKNWYPDGKLKEIVNWKNGHKNGRYILYNAGGIVLAKGTFKNNELKGKFKTYDNFGKVSSVRKYKNGIEIIKKEKKTENQELKTDTITKRNNKFTLKNIFGNKKKTIQPNSSNQKKNDVKKQKKRKDTSPSNNDSTSQVKNDSKFVQKLKSIFKKKPKEIDKKTNTNKAVITT
jgi:hypothetical protein